MFAFLRGQVFEVNLNHVVLDVDGVGYELQASTRTLNQLSEGETITLHTHLHLSQDAIALYGFLSKQEKQMFLRLISVSRIGPKVALAALSTEDAATLAVAIATADEQTLGRIPGLGKKTAQRVILELKEKIAKEDLISAGELKNYHNDAFLSDNSMQGEAITALIALGYDRNSAMSAVALVDTPCERVEQLITLALQQLAR